MLRLPAAARLTRRARFSALGAIAVVVGVASSPDAIADENSIAPELGFRIGLGLPLGSVDARPTLGGKSVSDPLDQTVTFAVPVWFDLGLRFARRWYVGLALSAAPGWLGSALGDQCNSNGVDCTVFDFRAGVDVHYHLRPGEPWDPWFGGGLGYEWLWVHVSQGNAAGSGLVASGWELANLQAGLDCRSSAGFNVGPFVALTAAEYSSKTGTGGASSSFDGALAIHGWLVLGVRVAFDTGSRPAPGTR